MFDLKQSKFTPMAEMKVAKVFNGSVHLHAGFIYAIGGNEKDVCERYDTYSNKWESISSYNDICKINELNGWCQIYCPETPALSAV